MRGLNTVDLKYKRVQYSGGEVTERNTATNTVSMEVET